MTLRILGADAPQARSAPIPTLAELHHVLESSVERLSSGISFRSLHSSAAHSAAAVEQKAANTDLIRSAGNAQHIIVDNERTVALIAALNEELTTLYGICQNSSGSLKNNSAFASVLERIKEHLRPESKIVPLFDTEIILIPELKWNIQALHIDLEKPKEEILSKISEAISLLAYAKARTEADICRKKSVVAKLLISRENASAASCATPQTLKVILEYTKETRL